MTDHPPLSPDGGNALDFCLRLARAQALIVRRFDSILGNLHGLSFSDYQLLYHLQRAPGGRLRRIDLAVSAADHPLVVVPNGGPVLRRPLVCFRDLIDSLPTDLRI